MHKKIIIIILLIILLHIKYTKSEHLTNNSDEAIQNLASMYNSGNVITNKLNLGTKWSLSGVGDGVDGKDNKDDWLRLTDKDGKTLYGGAMMDKISVNKDAEIKGNLNIGKNLMTPTIQSNADKITIGKANKSNDVFIPRKWYTINANFPNGDIHDWPISKINLDDAKIYTNTRIDISRLTSNNDRIWFKSCNNGNHVVAGKDWPDEMIGCGYPHSDSPVISTLSNMKNIQNCKEECKKNSECKFAHYDIWEEKCYLRKDGTDGYKTDFLNRL
jgi:hypothetical protein